MSGSATSERRAMLVACATDAWYGCDQQTRGRVLDRLTEVMAAWVSHPRARFLTSFDDDVAMAGHPGPWGLPSSYVVLAVHDHEVIGELVQMFREGELRLDRYFSVRGMYGREFWPIEPDTAATPTVPSAGGAS